MFPKVRNVTAKRGPCKMITRQKNKGRKFRFPNYLKFLWLESLRFEFRKYLQGQLQLKGGTILA